MDAVPHCSIFIHVISAVPTWQYNLSLRTCDGPIFNEGGCTSYTTTPLLSAESHCMGSVCIVSRDRRDMSVAECVFMNNLGEMVAHFLDPKLTDGSSPDRPPLVGWAGAGF